jgi:NMD protein affecting ribosome stability and mRNA decay
MTQQTAKSSNYFEGTLQLRDCPKEVISFVREKIREGGIGIAKEKKYSNGVDLYLSSNKFLRNLGRTLKTKFGGVVVESARLFSRDKHTSKVLYRLTVLFRMLPFKVGSIIDFRGDQCKVMSIVKGKITLKEIATGKSKMHEYKELQQVS